jgi:hypothetical protein
MELSRGKLVIFRQYRLTLVKRFPLSPFGLRLPYGALQRTIRQEVRPLESLPHARAQLKALSSRTWSANLATVLSNAFLLILLIR